MLECFDAHAGRAGVGLQLLPGVQRLLEALQVWSWGFGRFAAADDDDGDERRV
jgi:hypothetical protein